MDQDIFQPTRVTAQVGGKDVILECGRLANQADGAVWAAANIPQKYLPVVNAAAESYRGNSDFPRDIFAELLREFAEYMLAEIKRG